jgi:hypothetical protein
MRVLIDADGCPVVKAAVNICFEQGLDVVIICDTAHVFSIDNVQVITVDKGADSADFRLVNMIERNDIVVTQDYGLAAMCLARRAIVLNQDGMRYTESNIDMLLSSRYIAKKIRSSGGRMKGPSKRTEDQNKSFQKALINLTEEIKSAQK